MSKHSKKYVFQM